MSDSYTAPSFKATKFHCIRCRVYSHQEWSFLDAQGDRQDDSGNFPVPILGKITFTASLPCEYVVSKCSHCRDISIWYKQQIIFPHVNLVENPNNDLTYEVKDLYNEAATILNDSPRASGALLRLALQLLLKDVGGKGENINTDIKAIVSKGVDAQVQKALDIIRVFGNNGAHPGEIDLNEKPELVTKSFELINFVASKLITQRKEIDTLFDDLPESIKVQIKERDNLIDSDNR